MSDWSESVAMLNVAINRFQEFGEICRSGAKYFLKSVVGGAAPPPPPVAVTYYIVGHGEGPVGYAKYKGNSQ